MGLIYSAFKCTLFHCEHTHAKNLLRISIYRSKDLEHGISEQATSFFFYLCIVLRPSQERQLVSSREVRPDLLHLAKTLPLPPLGSAILEPHLQKKKNNL